MRINIAKNGQTILRHSLDTTPQRETTVNKRGPHRVRNLSPKNPKLNRRKES